MPAPTPEELGPLAGLAGTWEGSKGLDVSYHNADGEIGDTPYREQVTLAPFGPVDNGHQQLFGLDYRMAAWRGDEEDPFHTEVGYWLWDAGPQRDLPLRHGAAGHGRARRRQAAADATSFTLTVRARIATVRRAREPVPRRAREPRASSRSPSTWARTRGRTRRPRPVKMAKLGGDTLAHTDRNELTRVAE